METVQFRKGSKREKEQLFELFPNTISLYPNTSFELVHLDRDSSNIQLSDYNIYFNIHGDLKGLAISSYEESLVDQTDKAFIKGLFIESMNVIWGHFLTMLDRELHQLSQLEAPQSWAHKEFKPDFIENLKRYNSINLKYDLKVKDQVIPCHLHLSYLKETKRIEQ